LPRPADGSTLCSGRDSLTRSSRPLGIAASGLFVARAHSRPGAADSADLALAAAARSAIGSRPGRRSRLFRGAFFSPPPPPPWSGNRGLVAVVGATAPERMSPLRSGCRQETKKKRQLPAPVGRARGAKSSAGIGVRPLSCRGARVASRGIVAAHERPAETLCRGCSRGGVFGRERAGRRAASRA